MVPRMDIESPGDGVMAVRAGTVTAVTERAVEVDGVSHQLRARDIGELGREGALILPTTTSWQEAIVQEGDVVVKRALLARGITHIYFQANIVVFTGLVFVIGLFMGMGMAAVYKHVPDYFPNDVGTVGGIVGVLGGLGGFVGPILFGYLLDWTGIWTTSWMFLFAVSLTCLVWMHTVIRRMLNARAPEMKSHIDEPDTAFTVPVRVQCPVHGVDARVRLVVFGVRESPALAGCSLLPDHVSGQPCEGRCISLDVDNGIDVRSTVELGTEDSRGRGLPAADG